MSAAKQGALIEPNVETVPAPGGQLAVRTPTDPMVEMLERLATNPAVDVAKLEKLIDMQERVLDRNAREAFNAAFAEMQAEIPTIVEKGKTDKGFYAKQEDIIEAVRPVLKVHGFSLSFRTEWPDKTTVKVVGILTHRDGHSRESEFMSAADSSGSKNAIQALGSAVSYGRRYTTTDLLNIASREDDDGQRAGKVDAPPPPSGFEDWYIDMEATAPEGIGRLQDAWNKSKKEFREYTAAHQRAAWEALKLKARQVTQKAASK